LLAVRAGKEKSALKSALLAREPKASDDTVGLLVGDLPGTHFADIFQQFKLAVPKTIRLETHRAAEGLTLRLRATLANADEAKRFVESAVALKKSGLDGLKFVEATLKNDPTLPPGGLAALRKSLNGLQLEADGTAVTGQMVIPTDVTFTTLGLMLRVSGATAEPPAPAVDPPPKDVRPEPAPSIQG
jgi:hypothetical protein